MKLNHKHKAFLDEYFENGFNGKMAYKSAYPNVKDSTAEVNASKLLSHTKVKAEYERRQAELRLKHEINRDEIVEVLKDIMDSNKKKVPPHALKAAEILIRLAGLNAPDKQDITIKTEQRLFGDPEEDTDE